MVVQTFRLRQLEENWFDFVCLFTHCGHVTATFSRLSVNWRSAHWVSPSIIGSFLGEELSGDNVWSIYHYILWVQHIVQTLHRWLAFSEEPQMFFFRFISFEEARYPFHISRFIVSVVCKSLNAGCWCDIWLPFRLPHHACTPTNACFRHPRLVFDPPSQVCTNPHAFLTLQTRIWHTNTCFRHPRPHFRSKTT